MTIQKMSSNKEKIYIAIIVILLALSAQVLYTFKYLPYKEREVKVYYNQQHPLNREIISIIRDADKFVYFAVYTFTRSDIKDALLAAKHRGLEVVGIVDREQTVKTELQGKIVTELKKAGIPVYEQDHSAIMHLKALVTEKAYASGSFNWTSAATNLNDEVLEIGRDESIRAQYESVLKELFRLYETNSAK